MRCNPRRKDIPHGCEVMTAGKEQQNDILFELKGLGIPQRRAIPGQLGYLKTVQGNDDVVEGLQLTTT
jgi:hypothetical protein